MSDDQLQPDENDFESGFRDAAHANVAKAGELEAKLLARLEDQLPNMSGKDAASAVQALANMKARNIEKLKSFGAAPESEVDPEALIALMIRKGYLKPTGQAAAAFGLDDSDDEAPPK